jgi:hypothetical protein
LGENSTKVMVSIWISVGKGDLNFTFGASKIWGLIAQMDSLVDFFISKLDSIELLDIHPTKISSTWRKMRTVEVRLAK